MIKKGNILLIDDEIEVLEFLSLLLENHSDQVFIAENANEGLHIFDKELIHCIVCDIKMPNVSGVEVLKSIRKVNLDVPFIFYTGFGDEELMMEAIKYGAYDFINKPELTRLVEVARRGLREGLGEDKNFETIEEKYLTDFRKILEKNKGD